MARDGLAPEIVRPIPRRGYDRIGSSTGSSTPSTPAGAPNSNGDPESSGMDSAASTRPTAEPTPSRQRSLLNLTSSALFGIYSPTTDNDRDGPLSPPASIPNTPRWTSEENGRLDSTTAISASKRPRIQRVPSNYNSHAHHHHHPHSKLGHTLVSLGIRTTLLFLFGVTYGVIITHLHDEQKLAPVEVVGFHSFDWAHSLCWGVAGVALGSLLPWIDLLWENKNRDRTGAVGVGGREMGMGVGGGGAKGEKEERDAEDDGDEEGIAGPARTFDADWNSVVRSIGAFVGIAFAIVSCFRYFLLSCLALPVSFRLDLHHLIS